MEVYYGFGCVCFVIAMIHIVYWRHIAAQNFFFKRAPHLKISEIHTFDDAWITGLVEAPKVVIPPVFGNECVYYVYQLFKKSVRVEKDSQGKVRRTEYWELVQTVANAAPFYLNDGTGRLVVSPTKAVIKFAHSAIRQSESWRHVLTYLPASGIMSSVGVASEQKDRLTAKGEIPLLLTPMGRQAFMKAIKSEERWTKTGGLILLWSAIALTLSGMFIHTRVFASGDWKSFIPIAGLLALIPFSLLYYGYTYNSMVSLRSQLINSWANVDIELKIRRDLIPNIVQATEAYFGHERGVLSLLSILRESLGRETKLSNRISLENNISRNMAQVVERIEASPELHDEICLKLHQELKTIEQKIAHAKSHFNAVVEEFNNLVKGFPSHLVALTLGFKAVPFYGENSNPTLLSEKRSDSLPSKPNEQSITMPSGDRSTDVKQTQVPTPASKNITEKAS
jgi:LemA protein